MHGGVGVGVNVGVAVRVNVPVGVGVRVVGMFVGVVANVAVEVGVGVPVGGAGGVTVRGGDEVGVTVAVLVGVLVGVLVEVRVGVLVRVVVGVGVRVRAEVGVTIGVLVAVGDGASTVVVPEPIPVPFSMPIEATASTRPSWLVCMPAALDESIVGALRTSTKKLIVQLAMAPEPAGPRTTGASGMNSTSPVVGSGDATINTKLAQAVPALPVTGSLMRKTPGSALAAGQGTGAPVPHDGVCLMRPSVSVPSLCGAVDVLTMVRPTGTLVSPMMTSAG